MRNLALVNLIAVIAGFIMMKFHDYLYPYQDVYSSVIGAIGVTMFMLPIITVVMLIARRYKLKK